jgi:hypothetical protein
MTRGSLILLLLSLPACDAGTSDRGDPQVDDSGDTEDGDTEDAAPCELLLDGIYDARGSCFGMTMTVALDMDEAACSFVLEDWSMDRRRRSGHPRGLGVRRLHRHHRRRRRVRHLRRRMCVGAEP